MFTKKISANIEENALLELTDEQLTQVTGGDLGGSGTASATTGGLLSGLLGGGSLVQANANVSATAGVSLLGGSVNANAGATAGVGLSL